MLYIHVSNKHVCTSPRTDILEKLVNMVVETARTYVNLIQPRVVLLSVIEPHHITTTLGPITFKAAYEDNWSERSACAALGLQA